MSVDLIGLAWIETCLILVTSALAARRLSATIWLRMAALWLAIFAGAAALIRLGSRFLPIQNFT